MSSKSRKSAGLLTIAGTVGVLVGMLVAAQSASAIIVRPNSATPMNVSVVLAYTQCTTATPPGTQHNPANLPGAACNPPSVVTPRLTAGCLNGDPCNFKGFAKLVVVTAGGDDVLFPSVAACDSTLAQPGAPPACAGNWVQDVRCTQAYANGALPFPFGNPGAHPLCNAPGSANTRTNNTASIQPDYSGAINVIAKIRITDEQNSGPAATCTVGDVTGCTLDATVEDLDFAVPADCIVTNSAGGQPYQRRGGTCLPRWASAGALCGCVATNHRSNIEVGVGGSPYNGGIFSTDGGRDGVVPDLIADADLPLPYTRQGIFLP